MLYWNNSKQFQHNSTKGSQGVDLGLMGAYHRVGLEDLLILGSHL